MENNHFEAVIIGGGPAGSAAAIYLKNFGFDVCVIEKKTFPRDTLCGEFLSVEVFSAFTAIGIEKEFLNLNPNPVSKASIINDTGDEINSELRFPAYGIKRSTLDQFLLSTAVTTGTALFQPAEVISISRNSNKYKLEIKKGEKHLVIFADFVIAAYGKQNILDKQLSRSFVTHYSGINGIKYHFPVSLFKDYPVNQVQVYISDGIYCGVNAVNDNNITFCFLEDHKKLNNSPYEQLMHLAEKNLKFSILFKNLPAEVIRTSKLYGTGNIYFGKREKSVNGIFMIGDAAGVIAPLAGDGLGMAMESALILAEILNDVKKKKISMDKSYGIYSKKWDKQYSKRLRTALLVQKIFLSGKTRNTVFHLALLFPGMTQLIIKNTRSPV